MTPRRALTRWAPVAFVLFGAAVFAFRLAATAPNPEPSAEGRGPAPTYPDFEVQTASGALALSDLRPRVVLVYFGYTACPDICPTTLAAIGAAFGRLSAAEAARATTLFVSVDPARDTASSLAAYVRFFHPSFVGGTIAEPRLRQVGGSWGVFYEVEDAGGSAMGYTVDHSTQAFLVGPDGQVIEHIPHGATPAEIAAAVRRAL